MKNGGLHSLIRSLFDGLHSPIMRLLDILDTLDAKRHTIPSIEGDFPVHVNLAEDTWSAPDGTGF